MDNSLQSALCNPELKMTILVLAAVAFSLGHDKLAKRYHWKLLAWLTGGFIGAWIGAFCAAFAPCALGDWFMGTAFIWWLLWVPGGTIGLMLASGWHFFTTRPQRRVVGCKVHGSPGLPSSNPGSTDIAWTPGNDLIIGSMTVLGLPGALGGAWLLCIGIYQTLAVQFHLFQQIY